MVFKAMRRNELGEGVSIDKERRFENSPGIPI